MKLQEVCELIVDCEHKTAPTQDSGYPSIRTPNIGRGYFILNDVNRVSEETYRLWTRRARPQPGDLIMAREAPVGNVAIIPEGLEPCLGQRTLLIRPDPSKVDPLFLNYFLNGPYIQGLIQGKTNGATVAHLNMEDVRTMYLPAPPPLSIQRRTAKILGAYDDLIENNARRIKILEEMAQMVYREWFANFHFPGYEKLQLAKRGEGGQIPMGWRVGLLGELVSLRSGFAFKSTTFDSEGLFGLVTIRNVHDGAFSPECQSRIADLPPNLPKYCVLEAGDIVMSLTGNIGRVCFVFGSNLLLNQRVAKVISSRPCDLPFVYFLLRQTETQKRFEQISTGVAQQNLSPVKAMEEKVVVPPEELRERFGEIVQPMTAEIVNLFTCGTILRQTRDLLLPKLVSGEINLENVEANALSQIP